MFINDKPFGNGIPYDSSCESCGKSFTAHGLMHAYSPYSCYCKECADKKAEGMIEEKVKKEKVTRAIKESPCKSSIPIEKIRKAVKEVTGQKMNIKDAIIALYEGKKVRSLPPHHEYVLRNGKIDYVDETLKEKMDLLIANDEFDCEWEIVEDE